MLILHFLKYFLFFEIKQTDRKLKMQDIVYIAARKLQREIYIIYITKLNSHYANNISSL